MAKRGRRHGRNQGVQLSLKSDLWQSRLELSVPESSVQLSLKSDLWQSVADVLDDQPVFSSV